jgi:hypothetical protein
MMVISSWIASQPISSYVYCYPQAAEVLDLEMLLKYTECSAMSRPKFRRIICRSFCPVNYR